MALSSQLSIRIGVIGFSILWGIWEQRLAIRNRCAAKGDEKDNGSLIRINVAVFLGITIASFCTFSDYGALPHPLLWEIAGISLAILGFGIRLSAMHTLSKHFTHRVTILENHVLIRDGLYRWIRHPSYLGQIILLLGIGCALANVYALAAAPLFATMALIVRITMEERILSDHFGKEFDAYRKATSRLLPGLW